jgi:Ca2+-binding RTX toxin-like protein
MVDGGSGNDILHGNRGSDTLTGVSGGDQCHFSSTGGSDIVTDFNPDDGDRLIVSDAIIDAQQTVDGNLLVTLEGARITLIGVQLADWETQGASWLL